MGGIGFVGFFFVMALIFLGYAVRILKEYERGVVYTLGRYSGVKGPGLILLIPIVQTMTRIDLRVRTIDVPSQDIITKDNISVKVNAVIYYRVIAPEKSINNVADFMRATSELSQTTLREVLGKHELDDLLTARDKLSADIRELLDGQTDQWGIKVQNVALKHIDLAESMIRAIGRQAEAERERRAKIISAEGELQAADKLVEAATKLGSSGAMQLRYLSAFQDIANDRSSTIILPLPMEFLKKIT
ncbi:MAG: slipin family protein [Alphaproteobacteria bacterium]|jgi:regulator of protease activity HflC (stomatin/prohibitin superfamily)|nr:slipin family protein [Alphaproteobacteria bacterium]